jgi:hypothetical protein
MLGEPPAVRKLNTLRLKRETCQFTKQAPTHLHKHIDTCPNDALEHVNYTAVLRAPRLSADTATSAFFIELKHALNRYTSITELQQ